MRLAQIIRSNPVKHFDAAIIHSTPRQSTPLEWFIIGAALSLEKIPALADVSIEEFISRIGEVSNVNNLIKRSIINLMNVGALEQNYSIVADDSNLAHIPMNQLKVTAAGRTMHQEEQLPGVSTTDILKADVDILTGEVFFHQEGQKYDNDCTGINVCEDVDLNNFALPAMKVSQLIQKEQLEKEPRISWLNSGSAIQEVLDYSEGDPQESISWVNQPCVLNIKGNGVIQADMDDTMILQVLDTLGNKNTSKASKCTALNFDTEVEKISTSKETASLVQGLMLNNRINIRNSHLLQAPIKALSNRNKTVVINYGAEQFALEFDKNSNSLQVNIPASEQNDALFGSTAFATETKQMNINLFDITVGNTSREMELSYVPKIRSFSVSDFITGLVKTYGKDHRILLNLLIMNRQTQLFYDMVHEMGCSEKGLKNRVQFLREVADSNKTYVERSYLSPKQESDILFDGWIEEDVSTEEAYNLVKELDSESYIRNNGERMANGFDRLLSHWTSRDNLDLFWGIIKTASKTQAMQTHMATTEIVDKLYTDQYLENLFVKFGQIPPDIKSFFPAETGLLEIQKAYVKFSNKMSTIDYRQDLPDLEKRSIALNNPTAIQEIDVMLKKLNEMLAKLRRIVKNVDNFANQGYPHFFEMLLTLNDVGDWISPYLGFDIADFDNVYVTDTCAIMKYPQIVENEKIRNGRSALIIPKVVISELDGLKESSNDATAKKARDAIKAINSVMGKNWCFTEDSHPELLPADYPAENNGQRNNDNLILSVALHYLLHKPIMLMADNNFKNKALSEKISCINAKDFVDSSVA